MIRVLHVVQRLGPGGAARSLVALARATARGGGVEHTVASLLPADPPALSMARAASVACVSGAEACGQAMARADVTQVHFWNSPELYAWLRTRLPPSRLILAAHVVGEHPAQVLTRPLLAWGDCLLAHSPRTLELPLVRELAAARPDDVAVMLAPSDVETIAAGPRAPHPDFHVGYLGTVAPVKMHPRFVEMSHRVRSPRARFLVYGSGDGFRALARRAESLGAAARFSWRGYVADVPAVLAELDLFGYPLRPDTYAAAELVVQEAMAAGVPPVVFPHGGLGYLVEDGQTGVVVQSEEEYAAAIDRLEADSPERLRLSRNAREHARAAFGPARVAPVQLALYERLMARPKRERLWSRRRVSPFEGADAFVEALGDTAPCFRISLLGGDGTAMREAELAIAHASPVITDAVAGGVLHYRRHYPGDAYLRLWAGLVLAAQGRPALAAAEFHAAQGRGLVHPHLGGYLAEAVARAGGA